jgi:uncharacterized 2Fe-2S/4Fe-4S cluster protein (DUF4445 family)
MGNFGVGLDIGTTTIHAELVDLGTGETIDTFYAFNEQRKFGADVISRIAAAQAGKTGELFSSVNNQVEGLFQHFIKKNNLKKIDKCVVSGNTTMLHLFCGIDPSAMGQAPYTPEFLEERHFAGGELSLSVEQITLLPGISAFLGADITAGLALVDITGQDYNSLSNALFVDIGTNGEIAVWKKSEKRLLCCSTAAGPCFEEAQTSCGLSASDFVNAIADMRRSGIIDETGAFSNTFANEFTNGYTYAGGVITQKDVRQFQLGKSAIYSGIKMLCKNARLEPAKIDTVYIAGGMGYYLNLENAVEVKLLPSGFTRIKSCGNTSLKGAVKSLTDPAFLSLCREIVFCAETVDLANDKYFAAAFEHNMWF